MAAYGEWFIDCLHVWLVCQTGSQAMNHSTQTVNLLKQYLDAYIYNYMQSTTNHQQENIRAIK